MTGRVPVPATKERVPLIEFRQVSKSFGPIHALREVTFAGHGGTVHAVTGENGAGKSTLMKLLAGVQSADAGEIRLSGAPIRFQGAAQAREAGIATVFQELTLLPNLTVAENMFLGREPRAFGIMDRKAMRRMASAALEHIGLGIDPDVTCGDLSVSEQHMVEVAKASVARSDIVIYDEPTAALDGPGVDRLVHLIGEQKRAGKLVFYISHRLDEIFRLCDVTTVLKDGRHVETRPTSELSRESLVSLMVGRELGQMYPPRSAGLKGDLLTVRDYRARVGGSEVSFTLRRGEIVGLAGIEGQGQRDIVRALAGLHHAGDGVASKIGEDGAAVPLSSSAVGNTRQGIGFIPEDRKSEGLFLTLTIEQNIGIGHLRTIPLARAAVIDRKSIGNLMQSMRIRARDSRQLVSSLSGGNQQKVMFGRWMSSGVDLLLVEEPTRGVDVGAKAEIYRLLRDFTDAGGSVLLTTSELTEHLGICDRILVVREGAIVAELDARDATEEIVMTHALGARHETGARA
ncbi:sugar ABC transporter ATP-binding protein [Aquibium sp. LZ166]|uniref:Sugar ABC transporter ATP-binding protein n=1 Tax=Aquibium pacificus TaxID=3153579 RepID=A0ABV3SND8_9HYPH